MNKKLYVYISLICILSLVFSCFTAGAASISLSVLIPQTTRLNLINQYTPEYDSTDNPIADIAVYTYSGSIDVAITGISVDSYCNGLFRFVVTPSVSVPAGFTFQATNVSISALTEHQTYFTSYQRSTTNAGVTTFSCYFDNHSQHNSGVASVAVMDFTVTVTKPITTSNLPDPEPYITLSTTSSVSNNLVSATPEPIDYGFCAVIKESIINALNDVDNPIQDLLTYIQNTNSILSDIYSHNEQWYSSIVDELLANNQWNSTITDELIALYSELSINTNATINIASYTADLRSFMQTFPSWSSQVLTLLGKLADMNAAQQSEAAAIESQYDSLQQQQDNANAVVSAVPRPTFSAGQFDGDNLVNSTQRQNFTGFLSLIVGNSYITTIFLIIITFATAGFVLFGKKR